MQIIIFLLGLFIISCLFYGIASGVQTIKRGFSWLTNGGNDTKAPMPKSASVSRPNAKSMSAKESVTDESSFQHNICELRELFALFQQGALTLEEYQSVKQCLLAAAQSPINNFSNRSHGK